MIGYGVRQWKVYYLDLVSDSTRQLTQVLSVDASEGEKKKKLRFGYGIIV